MLRSKPDETDPHVQLATRIPRSVHRAMRVHCIHQNETVMAFLERAVRAQLAKENNHAKPSPLARQKLSDLEGRA